MDSQIFTNTIRGNYENPDEIKSKIVRIFLSSTFSGNFYTTSNQKTF